MIIVHIEEETNDRIASPVLKKWKINSDRHRIDAHYDDLSLLSPYLDDITASIKGFERVSVTEQEVIDAGQICKS